MSPAATDEIIFEGPGLRLRVRPDQAVAILEDLAGDRWAELRLLASVDTTDGLDETFSLSGPQVETVPEMGARRPATTRLSWALTGSRWVEKHLVIEVSRTAVTAHVDVVGDAAITDVRLLWGRIVGPRASGTVRSGAWFETVWSAGPTDPGRIVRSARESASIGVVSGPEPGRGDWFFTPGPFCFALSRAAASDATTPPSGPWLALSLGVRPGEAGFTGVTYDALDRGFGVSLSYEGKTAAIGRWRSPRVVLFAADDPTDAVSRHRSWLDVAGMLPAAPDRPRPDWWREPIFCGWGAQCALAMQTDGTLSTAATYATQDHYDAFLEHLATRGVVPGTVVIDDKWQEAYGTPAADLAKWPDLPGWIATRRAAGQHVLLWYKAWDPEGLPPSWCVRTSAGVPLAVDPTHPDGAASIRRTVRGMLGGDGLDADGLKIDFTARTPSGVATRHHGDAWGVELLRCLLDLVAEEARQVKPEALLIGHVPNQLTAPAVDMLRLNDAMRLDDPRPGVDVVTQMRYRADVVRAACPEHLIDTDDWCAPDLARWRAYAEAKPSLGVPALYYATGLDRSGEPFDDGDYALLRRTWAAYREREGLAGPAVS
ncbi:MAG TPA: hypothetical protein VD763_03830 [Candidatus Saccharimonadales bacterium]|nr:hypothetical protein [Candidatus Saccharimonadales bacterium]